MIIIPQPIGVPYFFKSVKPEFRNKDDTVKITAGESRTLNLVATANPVNGTYTLKRGETVITSGVGSFSFEGGILTISAVSKEDAGTYTVTCTNIMGSTSFDFTLDVLCK